MLRFAGLAFIGLVPGWPLRRALYRLFFGYRFERGARIDRKSVV